MRVERRLEHYIARGDDGRLITLLTFRDVQAMVACRDGLARVRWRRRQAPYFCDYFLDPECDVYGVGYGTLVGLQFHGLVSKPEEEGPLPLTELGDEVLEQLLAISGTRVLARAEAA